MVHKRTPYTNNVLKSVKILTAFNDSGDVNVLILTYASFYLPGGLMLRNIITSLFILKSAMICYLICNKQ